MPLSAHYLIVNHVSLHYSTDSTGACQKMQPLSLRRRRPPKRTKQPWRLLLLISLSSLTTTLAFVCPSASPSILLPRRSSSSVLPRPSTTNDPSSLPSSPPTVTDVRNGPLRFLLRPKPSPFFSPPSPPPTSLRIRRMEATDLTAVVRLAAREFVPLDELPEYGGTPSAGFEEQVEGWWLRQNVYWGMLARHLYPEKRDHQVFLLLEEEMKERVRGNNNNKSEEEEEKEDEENATIIGMIELSLQPTTGLPPPLLPLLPAVKRFFAFLGFPVHPYISNLLIDASVRRQGHAARLIAHAENVARENGFDLIYLHADGDYRPAVKLYENLGYEGVEEEGGEGGEEGGRWVDKWVGMKLRYFRKQL